MLGWTSNTVGLSSDPCSSQPHELPDVEVGPGVDDFVNSVTSQEWFRGTAPVPTKVGGASGWISRGRRMTTRTLSDLFRRRTACVGGWV